MYRIYIDESGDHRVYKSNDASKRYLGLTGIVIDCDYYREVFQPTLELLKQKHFPHNPDDPIILHREDIINKRGPFWRLRVDSSLNAFNTDLLLFLKDQHYSVISVVIDKETHYSKYGNSAYHPYHYCLTVILERYCGLLKDFHTKGDVMAESRGGIEDTHLKMAYENVFNSGTRYYSVGFFQSALTSHEIKLKPKWKNIAGLQLADMLAHVCKEEILNDNHRIQMNSEIFSSKICECINGKYHRHLENTRVKGYGKIFLS